MRLLLQLFDAKVNNLAQALVLVVVAEEEDLPVVNLVLLVHPAVVLDQLHVLRAGHVVALFAVIELTLDANALLSAGCTGVEVLFEYLQIALYHFVIAFCKPDRIVPVHALQMQPPALGFRQNALWFYAHSALRWFHALVFQEILLAFLV